MPKRKLYKSGDDLLEEIEEKEKEKEISTSSPASQSKKQESPKKSKLAASTPTKRKSESPQKEQSSQSSPQSKKQKSKLKSKSKSISAPTTPTSKTPTRATLVPPTSTPKKYSPSKSPSNEKAKALFFDSLLTEEDKKSVAISPMKISPTKATEEEEEPVAGKWNPERCSPHIEIDSIDPCIATYIAVSGEDHLENGKQPKKKKGKIQQNEKQEKEHEQEDQKLQPRKTVLASVLGTKALSKNDGKVSYFEVKILEKGTELRSFVTVGVATLAFDLQKNVGFTADSIGYRSDGSRCALASSPWGELYHTGDIIGCGIIHGTARLFFTKNGTFQGVAANEFHGSNIIHLFAAVTLNSPNQKVKINYGESEFKFDLNKKHFKRVARRSVQEKTALVGVFVDGIPFPLKGASVQGVVVNSVAEVTITHVYENYTEHPINATYLFPLKHINEVSKFTFSIGDFHCVSEISPKSQESTSGLLHSSVVVPYTLSAQIGTVLPQQLFKVSITLFQELSLKHVAPIREDALQLSLPAYFYPHYSAAWQDEVYDADAIPLPWIPYGISYDIHITQSIPISGVTSPSHPSIQFQSKGTKELSGVVLFHSSTYLSHDLELLIHLKQSSQENATVECVMEKNTDTDSIACMLDIRPNLFTRHKEVFSDYIFIVDCSKNMKDKTAQQTKNALLLLEQSLNPENTRIQALFCKHDEFTAAFDADMETYNDKSKAELKQQLDKLSTSKSNSFSCLQALKDVFKVNQLMSSNEQALSHSSSKCVILITVSHDIDDVDKIEDILKSERSSTTRIHALGIGNKVNHSLLKRLAAAGGGEAQFIINENYQAVPALLHIANRPSIANIHIDWSNFQADVSTQIPTEDEIGPVFEEESQTIYCLLTHSAVPTANVRIVVDGRRQQVTPLAISDGNFIHRHAVRQRIEQLELQYMESPSNTLKEDTMKIATNYQVMSSFTELKAEEKVGPRGKTKRLPIYVAKNEQYLEPKAKEIEDEILIPSSDLLFRLVDLQSVEGAFSLSEELADILQLDFDQLKNYTPKTTQPAPNVITETQWATALTCSFMESYLKHRLDEFRAVDRKARKYLSKSIGSAKLYNNAISEAYLYLKQNSKHPTPV